MVKGRTSLVVAGAGSLGLWLVSTSAFAAPATAFPALALDGTETTGQARASLLIRVQDDSEEGAAAGEAGDQDGKKKKRKDRDRGDRGRDDGEGGRAQQAPQGGGGGEGQQPQAVEQRESDDGRGERKKQRAKEKAEEERRRHERKVQELQRAQQRDRAQQPNSADVKQQLEDAAERQKKQREKEAEQKQKRREQQERNVDELRRRLDDQKGADRDKAVRDPNEAARDQLRQRQREKEEAVQEKKEQPKKEEAVQEKKEQPTDDAASEDRRRERFGRDDGGRELKREGEPKEDATGEDRRRERFGREGREDDRREGRAGDEGRDFDKDKKRERRAARRLDQLKELRKERKEGDRLVIEEPDNRVIFKDRGRTIIKHDERQRFRKFARDVREQRRPDGGRLTIFIGPDGAQIVTEYDRYDRMLRRLRRHGGREYVIIDNRQYYYGAPPGPRGYYVDLPPPVIGIPREDYIVDYEGASEEELYEALTAPPVEPLERGYALEEIQQSYGVRERMRSVDLDTINFDFGSWEVTPEYYGTLERLAEVINRIVQEDPEEVYLIEGHTDAVGNEVDNLSLSDRRAEAVAVILTENFGVPAENLVTQGYGEEFLKIPTEAPERANRRVSVRRITPLMTSEVQGQGQPLPR